MDSFKYTAAGWFVAVVAGIAIGWALFGQGCGQ